MGRARLILREKIIDEEGSLTRVRDLGDTGDGTREPSESGIVWRSSGEASRPQRCCTTITIRKDATGTSKASRSRTSSSTWTASWPTSLRTCDG